jgi:dephospho-CoA kinase
MKTIGLIGGVASGKSRVARMLAELGAGVLDADQTGHAVLAEDAEVRAEMRKRWGDAVFAADGSVDRVAVGKRVFALDSLGEANRRFLEGLLHPRIRRRLESERDQFVAEGRAAVVLDAPLLLEAGWGKALCDTVLFVDAPPEVRLARARSRGWSEADFSRREAAQWPIEEKRRHADVVLQNAGSEADLRQSVMQFWNKLRLPASP